MRLVPKGKVYVETDTSQSDLSPHKYESFVSDVSEPVIMMVRSISTSMFHQCMYFSKNV